MPTASLVVSGLLAAVLAFSGRGALGQGDSLSSVRGTVRTANGSTVEGANVFILQTLEGAVTAADGRFAFRSRASGPATLAVRRIGYRPLELPIDLPHGVELDVVLEPQAAMLPATVVEAGGYTAGDERGAVLTPLEVVTTPGSTADIARAIQTLPGVQGVDEGTGLYVRGGDYSETRILLNGAWLPQPFGYERPAGTFIGTVDPFLLDRIYFSSGGFGARFGNALSGIADLRSLGAPSAPAATAGVGLAAISVSGALPLTRTLGARVAANRFQSELMFRVNGSTRDYAPPPRGDDVSGSLIYRYRPTGELKLFAIRQTTALGLQVDEASFSGLYDFGIATTLVVGNWRDSYGLFAPSITISSSSLERAEEFGAFQLTTELRSTYLRAEGEWAALPRLVVRGGAELEHLANELDGSVPGAEHDKGPGARTTVVAGTVTGDRTGVFAESEWRPLDRTTVTAGVRTDASSLTGQLTIDPRLSVSHLTGAGLTLIAAWGVYHQVPDPLFFDPSLGDPRLGPMRATHTIIGAQFGEAAAMARLELYDKRYRHLAQMSRERVVVGEGSGSSRGLDLFLKAPLAPRLSGRLAYSLVDARRTDPHTGVVARAPFDISHSVTAVLEQMLGAHWRVAAAYRHATGRPFTPVLDAAFDAERMLWVPRHAAPMSERVPAFQRLDLQTSHYRRLLPSWQAVFYLAVSNVLDRENVFSYRYSADYTRRFPVQSLFNRSVYFGMSLTYVESRR